MPIRTTPLVTGEIYHVVNRGVNHQPIFKDKRDYRRALELLTFYQFVKPPIRFSFYNRLTSQLKENLTEALNKKNQKLVTFVAFCFMPNHFHFLVRQEAENGVSKFLANFQNSFTRYFNVRHHRIGHLFQGQFRTVRIGAENQLLHTSRYIHLNPYTSYVVRKVDELESYPWSSFQQYVENNNNGICELTTILQSFSTPNAYPKFVIDQKDYQRTLDQIKHLVLEQ